MALVDSDLFLVQDASTKANYKLSFENLTKEIALDIDLDTVYVEVDGDNMTGDLTLGTDNITLNASDGSAVFGVDRITLASTGLITTWRKTSNAPDLLQHWKSNVGAGNRTQVSFSADGSADFNGDITANAFIGDGSALTNLPVEPGLWVESGNNLSPITANQNLTSITDITASGNISAIQVNSTNINSSGNITANGSVNAGIGSNLITLDGSTGEITGGANVFIDGGTYT